MCSSTFFSGFLTWIIVNGFEVIRGRLPSSSARAGKKSKENIFHFHNDQKKVAFYFVFFLDDDDERHVRNIAFKVNNRRHFFMKKQAELRKVKKNNVIIITKLLDRHFQLIHFVLLLKVKCFWAACQNIIFTSKWIESKLQNLSQCSET